jgi:hypothetical protein
MEIPKGINFITYSYNRVSFLLDLYDVTMTDSYIGMRLTPCLLVTNKDRDNEQNGRPQLPRGLRHELS